MIIFSRQNPDWSVGQKGDVFHLIHEDTKSEPTNRLLPVGKLMFLLYNEIYCFSINFTGQNTLTLFVGIVALRY